MFKYYTRAEMESTFQLVPSKNNTFLGPEGLRFSCAANVKDLLWSGGIYVTNGTDWIIKVGADMLSCFSGDAIDEAQLRKVARLTPKGHSMPFVFVHQEKGVDRWCNGPFVPTSVVEDFEFLTGDLTIAGVVSRADAGLLINKALPEFVTTAVFPAGNGAGIGDSFSTVRPQVFASKCQGWIVGHHDLPLKKVMGPAGPKMIEAENMDKPERARDAWAAAIETVPEKVLVQVGSVKYAEGWTAYDGPKPLPSVNMPTTLSGEPAVTARTCLFDGTIADRPIGKKKVITNYSNTSSSTWGKADSSNRATWKMFSALNLCTAFSAPMLFLGGRSVFPLINLDWAPTFASHPGLVVMDLPHDAASVAAGRARVNMQMFLNTVEGVANSITVERLLCREAGLLSVPGSAVHTYSIDASTEAKAAKAEGEIKGMEEMLRAHDAAWSTYLPSAGVEIQKLLTKFKDYYKDGVKPGDARVAVDREAGRSTLTDNVRGSYSITYAAGTGPELEVEEMYLRKAVGALVNASDPEFRDATENNWMVDKPAERYLWAHSSKHTPKGFGPIASGEIADRSIEYSTDVTGKIVIGAFLDPGSFTIVSQTVVYLTDPATNKVHMYTLAPGVYTDTFNPQNLKKDGVAVPLPTGTTTTKRNGLGKVLFVPNEQPMKMNCVGPIGGLHYSAAFNPAGTYYGGVVRTTSGPGLKTVANAIS